MPTATINDIQMHYVDHGAGAPVLLVHGFPLDCTMWDPLIERLQDDCRLIAPDLRGYGKSTLGEIDPDAGVSMRQYADDLAGLLDAIGVDEPIVYCGFSMGGYIGWQFLEAHGERAGGLVMCDTRAAADGDEAREMRLKMARHVVEWGAGRVAEAMQPKLFAAHTLESRQELVAQTVAVITRTNPASIAAAQRGMAARPDMTALLPTLKLSAVGVVGEEDALTPPAEMEGMVVAMPSAELTMIPGAGHMTPVENPDAVAKALREFLERS